MMVSPRVQCVAGCRKHIEHKRTPTMVSSHARCAVSSGCRKHPEHEKTPTMVSPHVQHVLLGVVENTLSMKVHQRWCLLVLGVQ